MPTASEVDRERMTKWFGSIDTHGPEAFLKSHGFKIYGGLILPPEPSHNVSQDEWHCVEFLVDEWDYGYRKR